MLTGSGGEALLTPPGSRLSFKKLFLFGLGDARTEDELAGRVSDALRRLAQAGVRDAALQLPAKLPPERGVRTLTEGDGLARALVFAPEPAKLVTLLSQSSGAPQVERRVVKVASPPKASPPPRTKTHRTPAHGTSPASAGTTPPSVQPVAPNAPRAAPPPPQRYVPPPKEPAAPGKKRR
jgi:hypothetical protein